MKKWLILSTLSILFGFGILCAEVISWRVSGDGIPAAETGRPGIESPAQSGTTPANATGQDIVEQIAAMGETLTQKEEQVKALIAQNPDIVPSKAIESFRKAVASVYGSETAEQAQYEAITVRNFGDTKWKVSGVYRGSDDRGRQMEADWEMTVQIFLGGLQVVDTVLGDRRYSISQDDQ